MATLQEQIAQNQKVAEARAKQSVSLEDLATKTGLASLDKDKDTLTGLAGSSNPWVSGFAGGAALAREFGAGEDKRLTKREKAMAEVQRVVQERKAMADEAEIAAQRLVKVRTAMSEAAEPIVDAWQQVRNQGASPEAFEKLTGDKLRNIDEAYADVTTMLSDDLNTLQVEGSQIGSVSINPDDVLKLIGDEDFRKLKTKEFYRLPQMEEEQRIQELQTGLDDPLTQKDIRVSKDLERAVQPTMEVSADIDPFQAAAEAQSLEGFKGRLGSVTTEAKEARTKARSIDMLANIVDDTTTGAAAPLLREMDSLAKQVGLDLGIDPAGGFGQFATAGQELIKPLVEAQGRSWSDADLKLAQQSMAGIGNSKEANRAYVAFATALNSRALQKQTLVEQLTREGKANEIGAELDKFDAATGAEVVEAINFVRDNRTIAMPELVKEIKTKVGTEQTLATAPQTMQARDNNTGEIVTFELRDGSWVRK